MRKDVLVFVDRRVQMPVLDERRAFAVQSLRCDARQFSMDHLDVHSLGEALRLARDGLHNSALGDIHVCVGGRDAVVIRVVLVWVHGARSNDRRRSSSRLGTSVGADERE